MKNRKPFESYEKYIARTGVTSILTSPNRLPYENETAFKARLKDLNLKNNLENN